MTETSKFWNGTTLGDAVMAPYDGPDEFGRILDSLMSASPYNGVAYPASYGIFPVSDTPANAVGIPLIVSGTTSPVSVGPGRALLRGTIYENDAVVTVAVPTPAALTRIDRIILRKDYAAQTVRIVRLAGAEGGAAPALTRTDGVTWEIILGQVSITTGGVITLSHFDRRYVPRLANNFPWCVVTHNANQNAPNGATTVLAFNTTQIESFQPAGLMHNIAVNNSRIYAPYNGYYEVSADVTILSSMPVGPVSLLVYRNGAYGAGAEIARAGFNWSAASLDSGMVFSLPIKNIFLSQGDYIELAISQATGTNPIVVQGVVSTYITPNFYLKCISTGNEY